MSVNPTNPSFSVAESLADNAEQKLDDESSMSAAITQAEHARLLAPPNPWVGAVLINLKGSTFVGYTGRPGNDHAEKVALRRAGRTAAGSTLYVTLEPCSHQGRTAPCVASIIDARVARVVIAVVDPDSNVAGSGIEQLRAAGIAVDVGVGAAAVERQLAPYLYHRRTLLPYVVLKVATTIDGRTAAPDRTSQWITGEQARSDAHLLRAESDGILVGAGTVRADNPRLNVREVVASDGEPVREPVRFVLGSVAGTAAVQPCREIFGTIDEVLAQLGSDGIVQLLVEGGANVAAQFHNSGNVNRYVVYLAPILMGGSDGQPIFSGLGADTLSGAFRGTLDGVRQVGADLRIDVVSTDEV